MAVTYTAGGIDPISRLREAIRDTAASASFSDERLKRWLDDARSEERFLVWLPTGTGGATGATVEIKIANGKLNLILTREGLAETATTLELAPATVRPFLADVIRAIGAANRGWMVGLSIGEDLETFAPSSRIAGLVTTGRLATYAPSINLALTDGAVPAYGGVEDAARLPFYELYRAGLLALGQQGISSVESRSEGNVTRRVGGLSVLRTIVERRATEGLYAA